MGWMEHHEDLPESEIDCAEDVLAASDRRLLAEVLGKRGNRTTEWEDSFLASASAWVNRGRALSEKQRKVLRKIAGKFS